MQSALSRLEDSDSVRLFVTQPVITLETPEEQGAAGSRELLGTHSFASRIYLSALTRVLNLIALYSLCRHIDVV